MESDKKVFEVEKKRFFLNTRQKTIFFISLSLLFVLYVFIHGSLITDDMLKINFMEKNLAPSWQHPFGTDAIGRDMYLRTIKGLNLSIRIGLIATFASLLIASVFSIVLSVGGKKGDTFVTWLIDVFLSMPHMMFLILISVAVGKGLQGVIIGLALTHWTGLTRFIRAEIKQIKTENFISISKALGKSPMWIAVKHIFPHLISQVFVAMILLFPHAILHEAGISFLGFGLSLSSPAIGIILSESMKYLAQGYWWLAFFPGLMLVLIVLAVNAIGDNLKNMIDPYNYHD